MKLGISYMVFEGVELLQYATKQVRPHADFISVVYQTTSFYGEPAPPELVPELQRLKNEGLIDHLELFHPKPKHEFNELDARNKGLDLSTEAGCTHHIAADVDELCLPEQLALAKQLIGNHDCSFILNVNYYKHPTYRITPSQKLYTSSIHPVTNRYARNLNFPHRIDLNRRNEHCNNPLVFTPEQFVTHHMSFIRKNIRRKLTNHVNRWMYHNLDKFLTEFDNYQLGDRLKVAPDKIFRRTELVPNIFGIEL